MHLKDTGFAIDEGGNGAEGLKLLAKNQYDLMVVDLMMPVMDGIVMLRMKDALKNKTPVILLTAEVGNTLAQAMESPCVMDYLKKPLSGRALRLAVAQVLELSGDQAASE